MCREGKYPIQVNSEGWTESWYHLRSECGGGYLRRVDFVCFHHQIFSGLSLVLSPGVCEWGVGDQYWGRRQFWRTGADLRDPQSRHSQSQDRSQTVGHRSRQLQTHPHGTGFNFTWDRQTPQSQQHATSVLLFDLFGLWCNGSTGNANKRKGGVAEHTNTLKCDVRAEKFTATLSVFLSFAAFHSCSSFSRSADLSFLKHLRRFYFFLF